MELLSILRAGFRKVLIIVITVISAKITLVITVRAKITITVISVKITVTCLDLVVAVILIWYRSRTILFITTTPVLAYRLYEQEQIYKCPSRICLPPTDTTAVLKDRSSCFHAPT